MKKDTIVQFVGFVTNLELPEFTPKWEQYSSRMMNKIPEPVLHQKSPEAKNKFQFISQQQILDNSQVFDIKNEKRSSHFPELNVKVVHTGGYIILQQLKRQPEGDTDLKVFALLSHDDNDLSFYSDQPYYSNLNIYQAYFESCTYGYILEFFVPEKSASELLLQLKARPGIETGVYKECMVVHT